jgi:hypothetical protein
MSFSFEIVFPVTVAPGGWMNLSYQIGFGCQREALIRFVNDSMVRSCQLCGKKSCN